MFDRLIPSSSRNFAILDLFQERLTAASDDLARLREEKVHRFCGGKPQTDEEK
jgi:hypothetical protein